MANEADFPNVMKGDEMKKSFLLNLLMLIPLLTSCSILGAKQTPTPILSEDEFLQAVFDLCYGKRNSVDGSKPYDPANTYHPIMVLDADNPERSYDHPDVYDQTSMLYEYANWVAPETIYGFDLVACMTYLRDTEERYACDYGPLEYHYMDSDYLFKVYTLDSRNEIGSFTVNSGTNRLVDTSHCEQYIETVERGKFIIHGTVFSLDAKEQLAQYVFTGLVTKTP
jgi:hypothetical protein